MSRGLGDVYKRQVLARLAGEGIHPNDHVNCSQSSNDVIPTTLQVMAATELTGKLLPALDAAIAAIEAKAAELGGICKTGRTHLMDAMPLTFGQEMGAWAAQLRECRERVIELLPRVCALPIGGSAIGTGVNVPVGYPEAVVGRLSELTGTRFTTATNLFARIASPDVAVEASACLRGLAGTLNKINNDLRWMGSGPLAGLAEITLQPLQPGSSIMPGKVNPVLPEAVLMVCAEVFGNDVTIAQAGASGNFQLNVMLPLVADKLSSGISLLAGALDASARTVAGLEVNHEILERTLSRNPILATALNTRIGYEAAAEIARRAYAEGRPVLAVALEATDIPEDELRELLDPVRLTGAS